MFLAQWNNLARILGILVDRPHATVLNHPCCLLVFVYLNNLLHKGFLIIYRIEKFSNGSRKLFALLRSVIGPESSRHSLNQSDAKLKRQWQLSHSRFPALSVILLVSNLTSYWQQDIFSSLLVGHHDYTLLWFWSDYTQSKSALRKIENS